MENVELVLLSFGRKNLDEADRGFLPRFISAEQTHLYSLTSFIILKREPGLMKIFCRREIRGRKEGREERQIETRMSVAPDYP